MAGSPATQQMEMFPQMVDSGNIGVQDSEIGDVGTSGTMEMTGKVEKVIFLLHESMNSAPSLVSMESQSDQTLSEDGTASADDSDSAASELSPVINDVSAQQSKRQTVTAEKTLQMKSKIRRPNSMIIHEGDEENETKDFFEDKLEQRKGDILEVAVLEHYAKLIPQDLEPIVDEPAGRAKSLELAREAAGRMEMLKGISDVRDAVDVWKTERYCHAVFRHLATSKETMNLPCIELWEDHLKYDFQMTYNEVHKVAETVAAWVLAGCGEKGTKERIICVYLPRNLGMIASVIGSMYCGCGVAVVDTKLPWQRLEYIVKDTGAGMLITDCDLAGDMTNFECAVLDIAAVLPQKSGEPRTEKPWLSEKVTPNGNVVVKPGQRYDEKLEDNDTCVVIYTSGSTGNPKGVSLSYSAFSNYACIEQVLTIPSPKDRVCQTQSLSFIAGFHECWRSLCGASVLVMANHKVVSLGPDLEQWLRDQKITIMKAVPSLLRSMLVGNRAPHLPAMRLFHVGGEAVTQDIVDLFGPGRLFLNTYGSTETCSNCMVGFCAPGDTYCSIGRPLPSFKSFILDNPEATEEVAQGELYMSGISLAKGYLNLDNKTKGVFVDHPVFGRIFKTGDIVERLPDYGNCIVYRGRGDNQLKINGYRVELGEVEAKLNMIGVIKEAAAVAVDNTIYAFATISEGGSLTVVEMKDKLKGFGLPFFAMPGRLMVVESFPKTISGKLDRKVLEKQIADANKLAAEALELADLDTPIGIFIAVFSEILKCKVEPDDDFFNLGGNSGSAGQCIGLIRAKGEKIDLPSVAILDLYTHRTPKALADHMDQLASSGAGEVNDALRTKRMPIQDKKNKTLFDTVTFFFAMFFVMIDAFEVAAYFMTLWVSGFVISATPDADFEIPKFTVLFGVAWKVLVIKLSFYVLWITLSLALKWTVMGRYKEGRWAKFGPMHLRHWIVHRVTDHMPWRLIGGTGISTHIMRAFGARVGEGVFTYWEPGSGCSMNGYDLYKLEDFSSVCQGAYCSPIYFDDESMICGSIHLERFACLLPRATASGTVHLEEGAVLDQLSSVTDGTVLKAREFWSGSLASCVGQVEDPTFPPATRPGEAITTLLQVMDIFFGYFFVVCLFLVPRYVLLVYMSFRGITSVTPALVVGVEVISILFGICALSSIAILFVCTANFLYPSKAGSYRQHSWETLILWHKQFWFKSPQLILNNTSFLQWFAIACGMKMGKGSSISNVKGCVPDLISIGDSTFLANPTFLGVPVVQNGLVHVGTVNIGNRVLAGNNSLFPIHCVVPDDTTIAVNTSSPPKGSPPGGVWVGYPATRISDKIAKNHPSGKWHDRFIMFTSEVLIIFVPAIFFSLMIVTWFCLWVSVAHSSGLVPGSDILHPFLGGLLMFPMQIFWAITAGFVARVTLSGFTRVPVKKQVHFYHPLCYRWRIYNKIWSFFLTPTIMKDFSGCIWANRLINMLTMAEIEEDVLIVHNGVYRDHDFVRVRKGATINESCVFRTHTFEDWILKFDFVEIGPKTVVFPSCTVLYGGETGKSCTILANSLLLKGDKIADNTIVAGIPAAPKKNRVPEGVVQVKASR